MIPSNERQLMGPRRARRRRLTDDQVRSLLRAAIAASSLSQNAWARDKGLHPSAVCRVLSGEMSLTEDVAAAVGYKKGWLPI
jgi:hypothetical protein